MHPLSPDSLLINIKNKVVKKSFGRKLFTIAIYDLGNIRNREHFDGKFRCCFYEQVRKIPIYFLNSKKYRVQNQHYKPMLVMKRCVLIRD